MKQVIVMQGIPGSGKTSYARTLAEAARARGETVAMVSADDFFLELGGGIYAFDVSKLSEAHATCFRRFLDHLAAGVSLVIVDNTNVTAIELSPYMLGATAFGYDAKILRIDCEVGVALSRNVHDVPLESIAVMSELLDSEKLPAWWTVERVAPR